MNKILLLLFFLCCFLQHLDAQVDTIPPVLVCKHYPSVGFFLCNLTFSTSDFVETLSDDLTPTTQIQLGIRKRCTGNGFPENQSQVTYADGNDLGYQTVELWARDAAGNESSCYSTFMLNDVGFNCKGGLTATASDQRDKSINFVTFRIKGHNCVVDSVDFSGISTDAFGIPFNYFYHTWNTPLQAGFSFKVTPSKNDDPLNGITEEDLTQIANHILGTEPFDSPYQIIAADANQDGHVTTLDIKYLRKLMLGYIDQLPNGKSWRFVPYFYEFPDPQNPFAQPFPESIEVSNTEDPLPSYFNFKGIKIGDVNFSADPN